MLTSDFQKLSVLGLVTLYELDATRLGAGIIRWHGHDSFEDWRLIENLAGKTNVQAGSTDQKAGATVYKDQYEIRKDIIWQGQSYSAIPIRTDGMEVRGDGRASRPSLVVANHFNGVQGAIGALCRQFDDFCNAKLKVIYTSAKYLDAINFKEGNPSAALDYDYELWAIEQKTGQNALEVSFELSNAVDHEGKQIPTRDITNYCHWANHGRYRGEECKYMGTARYTDDGKPTDNPEFDKCGGRLSDCRLRNNDRNFGGFPSANLRL